MKNFNKRTPSPLRFVSSLCTTIDNMVFNGDISDARDLLVALNTELLYRDSLYRRKLEDESERVCSEMESDSDLPF